MFKGEFPSLQRKEFISNKDITKMRCFQNRCPILFFIHPKMDFHSCRMHNMGIEMQQSWQKDTNYGTWVLTALCSHRFFFSYSSHIMPMS